MNARALVMDHNGVVRTERGVPAAEATGRQMLLLVHGYNNNAAEASESYYKLRRNLDSVLAGAGLAELARRSFQENIWELYWPGFQPLSHVSSAGAKRSFGEPVFASPTYPLEVVKARSWVPNGLKEFLEATAPSEVFFLGHSLGCRVVLEVVAQLVATRRVPIRGFLLMAGAVPIHLLTQVEPLALAAMQVRSRLCLYSWHDSVLAGAFPPGQIAAGEIPPYGLPVATGLAGAPSGLYTGQSHTRLTHGDYWSSGIFYGVAPYAELLSQLIALRTPRSLAENAIHEVHSAKRSRAIPDRLIGLRLLPGDDWLDDAYRPEQ